MKNKTLFCFFTIIASAILALIIYDNYMGKKIHNEKVKLAKQNACEWMNQKYGINVEAVDARVHIDDDIFSEYETDIVFVTVREGDKEYHVDISGTEENAEGYDDYQAEDIENAVIDMIKADISGDFEYDFYTDGMYRQLYRADDEDSLHGMLSSNKGNLYVYYVNKEFEDVPVFDFLYHNTNKCTFYSFSSEEMMEDYYKKDVVHRFIDEYAPFITDYREISFQKRDNENQKYNVEKCNDLLYYFPRRRPEKSFSEISESEFDWVSSEYEFVSPVYTLEDEVSDINLWIPIPDDKANMEFYLAVEYDSDTQGKIKKIDKSRIIGSYVADMLRSDMSNLKIAFLCK